MPVPEALLNTECKIMFECGKKDRPEGFRAVEKKADTGRLFRLFLEGLRFNRPLLHRRQLQRCFGGFG
jgi:hypothetical protein